MAEPSLIPCPFIELGNDVFRIADISGWRAGSSGMTVHLRGGQSVTVMPIAPETAYTLERKLVSVIGTGRIA